MFNFYLDLTNPDFIDDYENEVEKNPDKIYNTESAHFVLCFLFDLLQFCFQFLVDTKMQKKEEKEKGEKGEKGQFEDYREPLKAEELIDV